MYFFFQKKGIFEKFRNNKVKKSESFMTERTASTDCPSSVSHEKVGQCRNNSKYESQKIKLIFLQSFIDFNTNHVLFQSFVVSENDPTNNTIKLISQEGNTVFIL